jgi:hypothetical protein
MKRTTLILAVSGLLLAGATVAQDKLSDADLKWSQAVEQMIREGKREFKTPQLRRSELLKAIAQKLGHTCEVSKKGENYWVIVSKAPAGSKSSGQVSLNK